MRWDTVRAGCVSFRLIFPSRVSQAFPPLAALTLLGDFFSARVSIGDPLPPLSYAFCIFLYYYSILYSSAKPSPHVYVNLTMYFFFLSFFPIQLSSLSSWLLLSSCSCYTPLLFPLPVLSFFFSFPRCSKYCYRSLFFFHSSSLGARSGFFTPFQLNVKSFFASRLSPCLPFLPHHFQISFLTDAGEQHAGRPPSTHY